MRTVLDMSTQFTRSIVCTSRNIIFFTEPKSST